MFRQVSIVVAVFLAALANPTILTAQESKPADHKTKDPPKELTVDLGKGVKLELVLVPAGEFMMGSPESDKDAFSDERPQHRVRITKAFYLGKYEVTGEQWKAVMGTNPGSSKGSRHAVDQVTWEDCQTFLGKLNAKVESGKFQLPSEAQWEYACRAGSTTKYFFGDDPAQLGDYAWYEKNSGGKAHAVGEKKPNAWGLYDMHGNSWEWCADWYEGGYYAKSPVDDPRGPLTGLGHVGRGGGRTAIARLCRSAVRYNFAPNYSDYNLGLRVACAAADQ